MKVFTQFFPHTGVVSFKQCCANHYSIVDFVILYIRGINTILVCITLVHFAALVKGDDLREEQYSPPPRE